MPSSKKPRKKHKIKPINAPAIRLTDVHARDLALQIHVASTQLDTIQGLNGFCEVLTKVTAAMEVDQTHDKQSRTLIANAIAKIQKSIDSGQITHDNEKYLQIVACNITDWLHDGRVSYRGFIAAKRACRRIDNAIMAEHLAGKVAEASGVV